MKVNKWTAALASAGVLSGVTAVQAEESPVMTALSSTSISGYVDVSAHWNPGNNDGAEGFSSRPDFGKGESAKTDGFNLNVVNLQITKPLDESQWAAGYHVDLLFGPDAVGYNTSVNTGAADSDFGVKQAYVNLRTPVGNGLDFKLGVFDTILGYEVFHNGGNPNYTRSYAWGIQPTQHTGVLASYAFSDILSASAGVANTHSSGINNRAHINGPNSRAEDNKTYMGSIALTAPESLGFMEGSTLYAGVIHGFNDVNTQDNYYVGATFATPVEGLGVGVAYDYVDIAAGNGYQNVFGLYASFQVTEKMSLHGRGEYAEGRLLGGFFGGTPNADGKDKVWAATGTLQYDLWDNVLTRLEVRWDQAKGSQDRTGWSRNNELLVAFNAIYQF
jgi:hypothetical protein